MQHRLPVANPAEPGAEVTVEGVLDRVVFANEDNGWSVIKVKVQGRPEVTAVGNVLGVQPGESLRLTGTWVHDRKFGEQLRVTSYLTLQPSTIKGIERYLGSGLVEGIGKAMAKRLVAHFGIETLEVIDHDAGRLTEVEGIGPVRSERIRDAWRAQRDIRDVMVFLQGHGVSAALAVKIYKTYGSDALRVVREHPYRLAEEVWGIGFRTADRIARDAGIAADDPRRTTAGVVHTLRRATDDGHVFVDHTTLIEQTAELLEIEPSHLPPAIDATITSGTVTRRPDAAPGGQDALLLTPLDHAESGLATRLRRLAEGAASLDLDTEQALRWYESRAGIELASQQRRALVSALEHALLVITGGPGTGKTTLIRGIVQILAHKGLRVLLAAPTGRAAKRLSEAAGAPAKTLHRLLEWNPRERAFTRGPELPLEADLLVIDESSMLDTQLAHHLLRAVPTGGRLVLVGDIDQLPSVGPGRVLADVIEAGVGAVVRLTEVFRQAQASRIVTAAHSVRAGVVPELRTEGDDSDFFFFAREEPEAVLRTIKTLAADRVPRRFGFDPRRDIQILTPMQRGLLGAANLNVELQALLNPEGPAVTRGGRVLRRGDRVMQMRNNYDLEVWNGDIGTVASIDREAEQVEVQIDDRLVHYDFGDLDELSLAYASSIHKAQGSEYPCVLLPLHTQHFVMLQRNLLYTALTRGRRLVITVGSPRALQLAVRTQTAQRRATLLRQRLIGTPDFD